MADRSTEALNRARHYLQVNSELREALCIGESAHLEPQFLGQGEHNENFWFADPETGEKFVLRVNVLSQPFHDDQISYEYSALELLQSSGVTPKPLFKDCSCSVLDHAALVMEFCEGEVLDFDNLRPGDLRCAAQLMADIHATPLPEKHSIFCPKDPLGTLFKECVERFEYYHGSAFEDARVTRWMEYFIKAAEPALETTCTPEDRSHLINTETLPSHFLIPTSSAAEAAAAPSGSGVSKASGRFCAHPGKFVDWERPIIGEPAQDLAWFLSPTTTLWDSNYAFPTNEVESFLEDYLRAVDGRFEPGTFYERFRAYRMVTALRTATWCCKALVRYGTDGAYQTPKTKEKLPLFLSEEIMEMLAKECF